MNIKKVASTGVIVVLFTVGFYVWLHSIENTYKQYKNETDAHKEKCLGKFKTIDYEIVSGVLYCKTNDGLVKFN